jgi:ribonuclease P protein component
MENYSFNKRERLKSKKSIEALFRTGRTIGSPPLRLLYRQVESQSVPIQMTVAVPKKLIKRAVDRNLLKRRTREAYRLNRGELQAMVKQKKKNFEILFLYQASELTDFKTIRNAVKFLLLKLSEKI